MPTLTETRHAAGYLVSEANRDRSRDQITVLTGENLKAGAVIGKATLGTASAAADAGNTGDGAMGAITVGVGAKLGAYRLTLIEPAANAGAFIVEDPDGVNVGQGDVAAAFSGGGLSFTLADGATDFAAGDAFTITVAAGTGKWREYDPANVDGSGVAAGILYDDVDATAADKQAAAHVRDMEFNAAEVVWFTGATQPEKDAGTAELATLGMIAR